MFFFFFYDDPKRILGPSQGIRDLIDMTFASRLGSRPQTAEVLLQSALDYARLGHRTEVERKFYDIAGPDPDLRREVPPFVHLVMMAQLTYGSPGDRRQPFARQAEQTTYSVIRRLDHLDVATQFDAYVIEMALTAKAGTAKDALLQGIAKADEEDRLLSKDDIHAVVAERKLSVASAEAARRDLRAAGYIRKIGKAYGVEPRWRAPMQALRMIGADPDARLEPASSARLRAEFKSVNEYS